MRAARHEGVGAHPVSARSQVFTAPCAIITRACALDELDFCPVDDNELSLIALQEDNVGGLQGSGEIII